MFDRNVEIVVEGTIVTLEWINPHVYMSIEERGAAGERTTRRIEAGPPSVLLSWGVGPESFRIGDEISVRSNPPRSGHGPVLGLDARKPDGTLLPLHIQTASAARPSEAQAGSIVGTWIGQPAGFMALWQATASWPVTEKARQFMGERRDAMLNSMAECVPVGPPALMVMPVVIVVERTAEAVVFDLDWMGARRVVYVDGRGHPLDLEPTLLGHSIGRWEGDVLVVDTVGFAAHPEGMGFEHPSSTAKRISERFALGASRKHLDYEITVEDAEYLTSSVTHRAQWAYRPNQRPSGIACDPAVARRFLTE
jgi:hypothetical protein